MHPLIEILPTVASAADVQPGTAAKLRGSPNLVVVKAADGVMFAMNTFINLEPQVIMPAGNGEWYIGGEKRSADRYACQALNGETPCVPTR